MFHRNLFLSGVVSRGVKPYLNPNTYAILNGVDSAIQKVSAQLEASKPAPQVVNNP
jgi:hypothetical protein